jgi:hypothetical protein
LILLFVHDALEIAHEEQGKVRLLPRKKAHDA